MFINFRPEINPFDSQQNQFQFHNPTPEKIRRYASIVKKCAAIIFIAIFIQVFISYDLSSEIHFKDTPWKNYAIIAASILFIGSFLSDIFREMFGQTIYRMISWDFVEITPYQIQIFNTNEPIPCILDKNQIKKSIFKQATKVSEDTPNQYILHLIVHPLVEKPIYLQNIYQSENHQSTTALSHTLHGFLQEFYHPLSVSFGIQRDIGGYLMMILFILLIFL